MKLSSFETGIRLQFDTLVKRVIACTVKNYEKELLRREKRETLFSELPDILVESFAVYDDYELDTTVFDVYGMEVRVSGEELSVALSKLSKKKRDIVLLSYFLEVSDVEIADLLGLSKSGAYQLRISALKMMKKFLKEV